MASKVSRSVAVRLSLADLKGLDAEASRLGVSRSRLIRDRTKGIVTQEVPRKPEPDPPPIPLDPPDPPPLTVPLKKRKPRPSAPIPRWCACIAPSKPPPLGCLPADVVAWFGSLFAVSSIETAQQLVAESGEAMALYSIIISTQIDHDGHAHPTVSITPIVAPVAGSSHDVDLVDDAPDKDPRTLSRSITRAPGKLRPSGHSPEACRRAYELSQAMGGEGGVSWAGIARMLAREGFTSKAGTAVKSLVVRSMIRHHEAFALGILDRRKDR